MTFAIRFGSSVPAFQRVKFSSDQVKDVVFTARNDSADMRFYLEKGFNGEIDSLFIPQLHPDNELIDRTKRAINGLYSTHPAPTIEENYDLNGAKGAKFTFAKPD